jgi:hypothetical protein
VRGSGGPLFRLLIARPRLCVVRLSETRRDTVEDAFLTVAEIAEQLKLNQQTVRNWI